MKSISRVCLAAFCVVLFLGAGYAAPNRKKPVSATYTELLEAARKCVQDGSWNKFQTDLAGRISAAVEEHKSKVPIETLRDLFYFRNVAVSFSKVNRDELKDMLGWLLEHRDYCGRFLHAVDEHDDLSAALGILKQLRDENETLFLKNRGLCIAYSVVWDRFKRYHWFEIPQLEPDTMMKTYRYFNRYAKQMRIPPSALPWELAIYVADLSITSNERMYVLRTYQKQRGIIGRVFFKVPYTRRLSPAHGNGKDIPYTLMNIMDLGGVCMEQAYFATQVGKSLGVPSSYSRGMGRSLLGHAWVSFLRTDKRPVQWDLHSGRYSSGHYWKGLTYDPTNWGYPQTPLSIVQMSAALLTAGSPMKLEDSYYFCDAADWVVENGPDKEAAGEIAFKLLERSLNICAYNKEAWLRLAKLAEDGKLTEKQTEQSVDMLFAHTLKGFPDFTLRCLHRFLGQVTDNKRKTIILARAFKLFLHRPDLAAEIKVAEGDLLLAEGKVKKAVVAYCWPLASFPGDSHVTGNVRKRIDDIGEKVTDKEELIDIYRSLLKSIVKNSQNTSEGLTDIFMTLSDKLMVLYTELGRDKDATAISKLVSRYLASRPRKSTSGRP